MHNLIKNLLSLSICLSFKNKRMRTQVIDKFVSKLPKI